MAMVMATYMGEYTGFTICKQQQYDADDNVVDIFMSKVRHLGYTFHQL